RQDRCAEAGQLIAHGNAAAGLSRGTWTANATRASTQLSDHQPRSDPGHESDQGCVSRLGHRLWRDPGLCCSGSRGMGGEDRARGGAPASRAALPTIRWIAGVTTNSAPRVIGGEPETSGRETAAADSLHRSDSGRALAGVDANPAPLSQQATIVDLQRAGDRDARQCAILLCSRTTATREKTA